MQLTSFPFSGPEAYSNSLLYWCTIQFGFCQFSKIMQAYITKIEMIPLWFTSLYLSTCDMYVLQHTCSTHLVFIITVNSSYSVCVLIWMTGISCTSLVFRCWIQLEIHAVEMPTSTKLSGHVCMTVGEGRIKFSYFLTQVASGRAFLAIPNVPARLVNMLQEPL